MRPGRSCSSRPSSCSAPDVIGIELDLDRYDLSLEHRRATATTSSPRPRARCARPATASRRRPSRPRARTTWAPPTASCARRSTARSSSAPGRRIPGVTPIAGVHHPISVVRMAVEDAYGAKQWREGTEGAPDEVAYRTEKVTRSTCRAVAEYAFRTAAQDGRQGLRRPEVDRLAGLRGHAQGGARRGRRAQPRRDLPAGADRRDLRGTDQLRRRRRRSSSPRSTATATASATS